MTTEFKLLKYEDIVRITGLSRQTIWRYWKSGSFPKPRCIGNGASLWLESDLIEWFSGLNERPSKYNPDPNSSDAQ